MLREPVVLLPPGAAEPLLDIGSALELPVPEPVPAPDELGLLKLESGLLLEPLALEEEDPGAFEGDAGVRVVERSMAEPLEAPVPAPALLEPLSRPQAASEAASTVTAQAVAIFFHCCVMCQNSLAVC